MAETIDLLLFFRLAYFNLAEAIFINLRKIEKLLIPKNLLQRYLTYLQMANMTLMIPLEKNNERIKVENVSERERERENERRVESKQYN